MSGNILTVETHLTPDQAGQYLTIPFPVPADTAELHVHYRYPGQRVTPQDIPGGQFTAQNRVNIIDLGLIAPDGSQVGASGSDKDHFFISETRATPGYRPHPLNPGEWKLLLGAYKIAPEGVDVSYEIAFTPKKRRLLLGDIHTHTNGSDGVFTVSELATHAQRQGLDFLAITDHNQMVSQQYLNTIGEITLIPGIEWTHYEGHANFLGVDQPYDAPFYTNSTDEMRARFASAKERGALIVINHPFDEGAGFHFDMADLPFDCLEVWNGPMRESNFRAVGLWQSMLTAGRKIPAVGGSDYHRDGLFQIIGGPCMGVYADSDSPTDILAAIRAGRSFITFAPNGPILEMMAGETSMGDTATWQEGLQVEIVADRLNTGDAIRVVSGAGSQDVFQAPENGKVALTLPVREPGFMRVEIYRTFLPGLPPLPALLGNPIYVE